MVRADATLIPVTFEWSNTPDDYLMSSSYTDPGNCWFSVTADDQSLMHDSTLSVNLNIKTWDGVDLVVPKTVSLRVCFNQ
jgi:hypothetical protein